MLLLAQILKMPVSFAWIKYATVDSNRFTVMAISNIALADIGVPKSFLESFPKNVKGSLGVLIH
ncbi:putative PRONE domain-containing protein [Helianthus annuus]|nr:putative PRONE domain-containing protein [Helianthus annuus]KAJ0761786.1 putative PRONE domain-containing protein [Helianthus annuus]